MKNLNRLVLLISSVFLASCASVYVPNAVNVPMLEKAGDVQLGGHTGINGFDIQASAAITDNFALMANGAFINETSDTANYRKRRFGEVGLGYFLPFHESGRFELYAGYGIGKTSAMDTYEFFGTNVYYIEGNYSRFFIQPSIGTETKVLDFGIALRMSYVVIDNLKDREGDNITYNEGSWYYEPVIFFRVGGPPVKLSFQWGFSESGASVFWGRSSNILSFGIVINLFY